MNHPSNRSTLGIFSILALIFSIYILARASFNSDTSNTSNINIIIIAISSFNVAIVCGWLSLGMPMGVTIATLSALIVMWGDLRAGLYGYSLLTFQFVFTALFCYGCTKARINLTNSYTLKLEKIDEEKNLILSDIREREGNIHSLEWKLDRYSILREAVEALSTRLAADDIVRLCIEKATKIIGKGNRVLFYMVDTEKQELELAASEGPVRVMAKTGDLFDHWVLRNRKSLIVEDLTCDFRFSTDDIEKDKETFRSLIETPLIAEDKVIGIIRMDSREECKFTQDDLRLLGIRSDLSAVAIQNAILYAKKEELSRKDGVTGLVVRRYFLERFHEELPRAAINKGTLGLLMLDIDHFKDYNDKYGHAAGDLVLKHLAKTLLSLVTEGDIVGRYGGEEMVILLCGRTKKETVQVAEEIRKAVKAGPLMLRRHTANITVSIGLATYPDDAILEEELIRIADERLYKAKDSGRDKVCTA